MFEQPLATGPADAAPTQRHAFGIRLTTVSPAMAERLHMAAAKGLLVIDVEQGGAASLAGIRAGDVLLAFAGGSVNTEAGIKARLASVRAHDIALVQVWRNGEERLFVLQF